MAKNVRCLGFCGRNFCGTICFAKTVLSRLEIERIPAWSLFRFPKGFVMHCSSSPLCYIFGLWGFTSLCSTILQLWKGQFLTSWNAITLVKHTNILTMCTQATTVPLSVHACMAHPFLGMKASYRCFWGKIEESSLASGNLMSFPISTLQSHVHHAYIWRSVTNILKKKGRKCQKKCQWHIITSAD